MNTTMNAIWTSGTAPQYGQTVRQFSSKNVWIKVSYAGLCRTDVLCGNGSLKTNSNRILGHEFSGVVVQSPDERFKPGDRVVVNPVIRCGRCHGCHRNRPCMDVLFLGKDVDGAFADFIEVPPEAVYLIPDSLSLLEAAYTEPVAASMSVLEVGLDPSMEGVVIGQGRIAQLTLEVLQIHGFAQTILLVEPINGVQFDFAIETRTDFDIESVLRMLYPEGICVLKCRRPTKAHFPAELLVKHSLHIRGANTIAFEKAIAFLESGQLNLSPYIGSIVPLAHFIPQFELGEAQKAFCQPHPSPEGL